MRQVCITVSGVGMAPRLRVQTEEKTHSAGESVGNAYFQSSMAESKMHPDSMRWLYYG